MERVILALAWLSAFRIHGARILAVQGAPPIPSERSEPDILARFVVELVAVVATSPLGGPYPYPARCPVDGAGVARGLDEGFDKNRRDVVALGPVLGQVAAHEGQAWPRRLRLSAELHAMIGPLR